MNRKREITMDDAANLKNSQLLKIRNKIIETENTVDG